MDGTPNPVGGKSDTTTGVRAPWGGPRTCKFAVSAGPQWVPARPNHGPRERRHFPQARGNHRQLGPNAQQCRIRCLEAVAHIDSDGTMGRSRRKQPGTLDRPGRPERLGSVTAQTARDWPGRPDRSCGRVAQTGARPTGCPETLGSMARVLLCVPVFRFACSRSLLGSWLIRGMHAWVKPPSRCCHTV